jgi:hypothetical protein
VPLSGWPLSRFASERRFHDSATLWSAGEWPPAPLFVCPDSLQFPCGPLKLKPRVKAGIGVKNFNVEVIIKLNPSGSEHLLKHLSI